MADKNYRSPATKQIAYLIWAGMKQRCYNPNHKYYSYYGGRGIKVCHKWLKYSGFIKDMGANYKKGLTIERVNNDGDYEKSNCVWADRKAQANNRSSSRIISWNGLAKTFGEWAKYLGVKRSTLSQRYYVYGFSVEQTLNFRRQRG